MYKSDYFNERWIYFSLLNSKAAVFGIWVLESNFRQLKT